MFIFLLFLLFCYNVGTTLKIFESFDGNDWPIKHAIRPLIPMIVIIIRYIHFVNLNAAFNAAL